MIAPTSEGTTSTMELAVRVLGVILLKFCTTMRGRLMGVSPLPTYAYARPGEDLQVVEKSQFENKDGQGKQSSLEGSKLYQE